MLVNSAFLASVALATLVMVTPLKASDGAVVHANPPQRLTVEHAEVLMSDDKGDRAEGYLTIWNGTGQQVGLEAIRSDAFAKISIVRSEIGSDMPDVRPVEGIVPVPGHAELTMRPNGTRLLLEEPVARSDPMTASSFVLVFEGGQEMVVAADTLQNREQLTIHHHGQGDVAID
ncbi:copper chaperone PCu(A)C [Nitratireductor rhodophyticola]|jgi:copper(I)-binding protein|uniref:copper chaperone PCu(A)C n=1 Tax=Nitratireductor rhodophyticola TaxID=2854036 RepID=UPI00300AB882